jgi:hypothetical protein
MSGFDHDEEHGEGELTEAERLMRGLAEDEVPGDPARHGHDDVAHDVESLYERRGDRQVPGPDVKASKRKALLMNVLFGVFALVLLAGVAYIFLPVLFHGPASAPPQRFPVVGRTSTPGDPEQARVNSQQQPGLQSSGASADIGAGMNRPQGPAMMGGGTYTTGNGMPVPQAGGQSGIVDQPAPAVDQQQVGSAVPCARAGYPGAGQPAPCGPSSYPNTSPSAPSSAEAASTGARNGGGLSDPSSAALSAQMAQLASQVGALRGNVIELQQMILQPGNVSAGRQAAPGAVSPAQRPATSDATPAAIVHSGHRHAAGKSQHAVERAAKTPDDAPSATAYSLRDIHPGAEGDEATVITPSGGAVKVHAGSQVEGLTVTGVDADTGVVHTSGGDIR